MSTFAKTLTVPTTEIVIGLGADEPYNFRITGTLADGTAFDQAVNSDVPSVSFDFPAGTGFVVVCSRYGQSSAPSEPVDFAEPATRTVTVPDATQSVVIA